jgi:hypothetical protein
MSATTNPGFRAASARRPDRSRVAIAVLATVLALWLGLTAPASSPVAAATPTQQVTPAADVPDADQDGVQLFGFDLFGFDRGRDGRGRR